MPRVTLTAVACVVVWRAQRRAGPAVQAPSPSDSTRARARTYPGGGPQSVSHGSGDQGEGPRRVPPAKRPRAAAWTLLKTLDAPDTRRSVTQSTSLSLLQHSPGQS